MTLDAVTFTFCSGVYKVLFLRKESFYTVLVLHNHTDREFLYFTDSTPTKDLALNFVEESITPLN